MLPEPYDVVMFAVTLDDGSYRFFQYFHDAERYFHSKNDVNQEYDIQTLKIAVPK